MLQKTQLAKEHPICRGVQPFETQDEWYYHMRFIDPPKGLTHILSAIPPDNTRERKDGAHSNNPTVRANKGAREVLAWAYDRPSGGRGFGCTGAHFHKNWENESFRTLILNALLWTTGLDVPADGVSSRVSTEELSANLDVKQPRKK